MKRQVLNFCYTVLETIINSLESLQNLCAVETEGI